MLTDTQDLVDVMLPSAVDAMTRTETIVSQIAQVARLAIDGAEQDMVRKAQLDSVFKMMFSVVAQGSQLLEDAARLGLVEAHTPLASEPVTTQPNHIAPLAAGDLSEPPAAPESVIEPTLAAGEKYSDNPLYQGLLLGTNNETGAQQTSTIDIIDDKTIRIDGQAIVLEPHELCLINVMLLSRDKPIPRLTFFNYGFYEKGLTDTARKAAFLRTRQSLNHKLGGHQELILVTGVRAGTKYRFNPAIGFNDLRDESNSGAVRADTVKKK